MAMASPDQSALQNMPGYGIAMYNDVQSQIRFTWCPKFKDFWRQTYESAVENPALETVKENFVPYNFR